MGEVLIVLLFQNILVIFEVIGEIFVVVLENGVGQVEDGVGCFLQVVGVIFIVDLFKLVGECILDVMVGGEVIDLVVIYGVVLNNYVCNGGDGYGMFESVMNVYDFGFDFVDVIVEYLVEQGGYIFYIDGCIIVIGN